MSIWLAVGLVASGIWLVHDGLTRPSVVARSSSQTLLRLQDWLVQAGLEGVTVRTVTAMCVAGALVGGVLAHLLLGWPLADLAGLAAGALTYPLWLRGRRARRQAQVQHALPEAMDRLRDALASGLTIDRAVQGLAEDGPEVLRAVFQQFSAELRYVPFDEAVEHLRDRLADPAFDLVAGALSLHAEVGGQRFRACLGQLAEALRADLAARDRLAAARARIVYSARLLAAVPLVLLVMLRWWSPLAARTFDGVVGQLLLLGCAGGVAAGYVSMLWLARLPGDERVLVR